MTRQETNYSKINQLVRVIYLMLNLVRRSFILYPTADYD